MFQKPANFGLAFEGLLTESPFLFLSGLLERGYRAIQGAICLSSPKGRQSEVFGLVDVQGDAGAWYCMSLDLVGDCNKIWYMAPNI